MGPMGQPLGSDMDMFAAKLSQIVHSDFHSQAVQTPLDLGTLCSSPSFSASLLLANQPRESTSANPCARRQVLGDGQSDP